nr:hypothetical protein [uncultured Psychroserpens sp.]
MVHIDSIELFLAINLFVIGLSHFIRPKMWVDFFLALTAKRHVGNLINALLHFGFGSLIFAFHFVWTWPKVLVTVYALLIMGKGILYLLYPEIGLKSISRVTQKNAQKFKWVGVLMTVFSISIFYNILK